MSRKRLTIQTPEGLLKKCTICKKYKLLSEFTHNRTNWDNLESYCRGCNRAKFLLYWQRNKAKVYAIVGRWGSANKEKLSCHEKAGRGYPILQPCSIIGCSDLGHRHHSDYADPLKITWLCPLHHHQEHKRIRELEFSITGNVL